MSKKKIDTRTLILTRALEMFNERGIEYVGLRELAANLGIRVSNITYYFPRKDDLVNQLTLELNQLNSRVMTVGETLTMQVFLKTMQQVFQNQVQYRSLMLSIVHIMEQNKVISTRHKQTQQQRNEVLKDNLSTLAAGGFLAIPDDSDAEYLASTISLISRFWISEAAISYRELPLEAQIRHNLILITHLLEPYATEIGKEQVAAFFAEDKA